MLMWKVISTLFLVLCFTHLDAAPLSYDDPDILHVMQEHGVEGTLIIASEDSLITYICNSARASTCLCPASTFKIANSIIAIEEGVLKDQYEMVKWDGQKHFLEAWNQDQNLKSAFKASCVWFYQELAQKIGHERYLKYFERWDYGNCLTGENITTFWLEGGGDLAITPLEQIHFLQKIYHQKLPISFRTYAILQEIMLEEVSADHKIYSKTGAATKNWVGHGWYVGYITSQKQTWFFVTNILINGIEDLSKRKAVTMAALKRKNII